MDEAIVILAADGRIEDATAPALELLGMSLPALRALPPGTLSGLGEEERRAMREEVARVDASALAGQLPVRRVDGPTIHVRFVLNRLDDGSWRAVLDEVRDKAVQTHVFASAGDVLSAWRAAERRLNEVGPDSPDARVLHEQISVFRAEYRRFFEEA